MTRRLGNMALLALAVLVLAGSNAHAADPQSYKVEMVPTSDGTLNSTLKATSDLMNLRTTAPVGPFGLIGRARGDLDRLKTVLESFGYYQSYVDISIDGLPLDDAALGEQLTSKPAGTDARVKISFSTGPIYHLRKVDIDGEIPPPAAGALGLSSGAPAVAADVLAAGERLVTALQDEGYAFAKVDPPIAHEDPPNRVLDVTFHVTTGARVHIGKIHIRGLKHTKEAFVRKRLLLHSGEQYGATRIETARRDLLGLGLFTAVNVKIGTEADESGGVPVTFQMRERLQHTMSVNAAYSSDLGGSTGVNWTKRNISGTADSLTLSATAINLGGGTATNGIGYETSAKYLVPDFGHRDQSLQVAVGAIRQYLVAYDQTAYTAGVTLNRKLSNIWSASAGLAVEQESIVQNECTTKQNCVPDPAQSDVCVLTTGFVSPACTTQHFHYTLVSLPLTALFNTTGLATPLEDARKGMRISLSVAPTFSVGRPNTRFFVIQGNGSIYFDLQKLPLFSHDPGRSVLALRALAGLATGASEFSLPPDQRFYAGGSGTIRGYRYQSVGPVFPDGNPIGGTAVQAGSAEYRQRIGTNFGTAFFLDAGQVSRNLNIFNSTLRFGTGAGVRYYTPIGPIRLDIAVPLNKRPGDDAFEIYIGLGQAF